MNLCRDTDKSVSPCSSLLETSGKLTVKTGKWACRTEADWDSEILASGTLSMLIQCFMAGIASGWARRRMSLPWRMQSFSSSSWAFISASSFYTRHASTTLSQGCNIITSFTVTCCQWRILMNFFGVVRCVNSLSIGLAVLFLHKNRFLALVLPNLNRCG